MQESRIDENKTRPNRTSFKTKAYSGPNFAFGKGLTSPSSPVSATKHYLDQNVDEQLLSGEREIADKSSHTTSSFSTNQPNCSISKVIKVSKTPKKLTISRQEFLRKIKLSRELKLMTSTV